MVPSRFLVVYFFSAVAASLYYTLRAIDAPFRVGSEPISIDQRVNKHLKSVAEIIDVLAAPVPMRYKHPNALHRQFNSLA